MTVRSDLHAPAQPRRVFTSPRRVCSARAGFTLIESLVALVVLAVVMLVAMRGIVTARVGLDRALSSAAAETVARSIVETQLDLLARAPGVRQGAADGVDWTVTAEPLALDLQPASAQRRVVGAGGDPKADDAPEVRWTPLRVRVTVSNGRGKPLTFETVHLARAP